jgi:hypothetical protein
MEIEARMTLGGEAGGPMYLAAFVLSGRRGPLLMAIVVVALIGAACDSTGNTTTSTREVTETTASETTATTATPSEGFTYNVGIFADIGRSNFWAYFGPDGTVQMEAVFGPTKPSLFRIAYPGLVVAPDVASGLPEPAVPEGNAWTVT